MSSTGGNIRKLGNMAHADRRLLTALKDIVSSGYEWRVITEIRSKAKIPATTKENCSIWNSFTSIGIRQGYFESRHESNPHTVYYLRPVNGSIDRLKKVIEYVEKE